MRGGAIRRGGGRLRLGIGDDAAILAPLRGLELIVTCDAFLEGVHFLGAVHPAESVGYKALVRATSDIAAMGAIPRWFLLTLALPAERARAWLDRFLRGMARAARAMGLCLAGGDTTRNPKVAISITLMGEIEAGCSLTRAGAAPGDLIYVSGRLGRADLGLELIRRGLGVKPGRGDWAKPLVRHHLYPQARLGLGAWLARHRIPSAMMDLSDGLSTDLARLCEASKCGAMIWPEKIPQARVPTRLMPHIRRLKLDLQKLALHGGDDYELLFTVPPEKRKALQGAPGFKDIALIAEMTRQRRILAIDAKGIGIPLEPRGWDPFRG